MLLDPPHPTTEKSREIPKSEAMCCTHTPSLYGKRQEYITRRSCMPQTVAFVISKLVSRRFALGALVFSSFRTCRKWYEQVYRSGRDYCHEKAIETPHRRSSTQRHQG